MATNVNDEGGRTLETLMADLRAASSDRRIDLRDRILAIGVECIQPLADLAAEDEDFTASVAAWLELMAQRDPGTRQAVIKAIARLARGSQGHYATEALSRMGGSPAKTAPTSRREQPRGRSAVEAAVHARIIQAARQGRTLTYGELETNRRYVGQYLFNISVAEAEQGHPPLTSIVVSKATGYPGDGFLPAMVDVGYAHRGETLDAVWKRAVADVHAFWRGRVIE